MTKKGSEVQLFKPSSDQWVSISLEKERPYELSEAILKAQVSLRIQRMRQWHYPALAFVSFQKGILHLRNISGEEAYDLLVGIEAFRLKVACSCGEEGEPLCVHAYNALDRLVWFGQTHYFRQFMPGGLYETAQRVPDLFKQDTTSEKGLEIYPLGPFQSVYALTPLPLRAFQTAFALPVNAPRPPMGNPSDALVYLIVDSYRNEMPPFLLPCKGNTSSNGHELKTIDYFFSGARKEYEWMLTPTRKMLNEASYESWKAAEASSGSFVKESGESPVPDALFQQWHALWPSLCEQPFVYLTFIYWKKELKGKPERKRMKRVHPQHSVPELKFVLMDMGEVFQLTMEVWVNGKPLKQPDITHLFFAEASGNIFLFSSLRDAALAEWMYRLNNTVTIFRHHLKSFESSFLKNIRDHYEIIRTKKKLPPIQRTPEKFDRLKKQPAFSQPALVKTR